MNIFSKATHVALLVLSIGMGTPAVAKKSAEPANGAIDESIEPLNEDAFANSAGANAAAEEFAKQAREERDRERAASAEASRAKNEAKVSEHQAKLEIARAEGEIKSARRATQKAQYEVAAAEKIRRKAEAEIESARARVQRYDADREIAQKNAEKISHQAADSRAQADNLKNEIDELRAQLGALRSEQAKLGRDLNAAKAREHDVKIANAKIKATALPEMARTRAELTRLQSAIDKANARTVAAEQDTKTTQDALEHSRQELASRREGAARAQPAPASAPEMASRQARPAATVSKTQLAGLALERDCNLREQPSASSAVIQPVLKGARLLVEDASGKWFRASGEQPGFIAKSCFR